MCKSCDLTCGWNVNWINHWELWIKSNEKILPKNDMFWVNFPFHFTKKQEEKSHKFCLLVRLFISGHTKIDSIFNQESRLDWMSTVVFSEMATFLSHSILVSANTEQERERKYRIGISVWIQAKPWDVIGNWSELECVSKDLTDFNRGRLFVQEMKIKNLFPIAQCIQIACLIPFSQAKCTYVIL